MRMGGSWFGIGRLGFNLFRQRNRDKEREERQAQKEAAREEREAEREAEREQRRLQREAERAQRRDPAAGTPAAPVVPPPPADSDLPSPDRS